MADCPQPQPELPSGVIPEGSVAPIAQGNLEQQESLEPPVDGTMKPATDDALNEGQPDEPVDAPQQGVEQPDSQTQDTPQEPRNQELPAEGSETTLQSNSAPGPDHPLPHIPRIMRERTDSQSTAATATTRGGTRSSLVFVITALESIAASKDARKRKQLGEAAQRALAAIKSDDDPARLDPEVLFQPLQLATEASTVTVVTTALDCIGKLISYSYFSVQSEAQQSSPQQPPLIERAIDTICDCFQGEATPDKVQLQIIGSLLAAVLNDKIVVHGAGLLKAIRQTYNIFLLSKSSENQMVAQTTLTQMVSTVFDRVKKRMDLKMMRMNLSKLSMEGQTLDESQSDLNGNSADTNGSDSPAGAEAPDNASLAPSDTPVEKEGAPITLQSFETQKGFDDARIGDNAPTMVTRVRARRGTPRSASGQELSTDTPDAADEDEEDEIFVKDAFLVFRAMCKLSTKALPREQAVDIKSHGMRSKLLSLHVIHTILHNNMEVFTSPLATIRSSSTNEPTPFTQTIKQYLCLSLSRNGASSTNKVFEVSCEIFWLMLKYLRAILKVEAEVFLKEIYLPILERRTAPPFQKQYILNIFYRLAGDPKLLVEIYLNYDCDRKASDNWYQRIIEHLSRLASQRVAIDAVQEQAYQEQHAKSAGFDWQARGSMPPSLSTATISAATEVDPRFPPDYPMKQQSLEAMVEVLRSLVNWAEQGITERTSALKDTESRTSVEDVRGSFDTRADGVSGSPAIPAMDATGGVSTPVAEDDPSELERIKQRKTALTSAIKQFNYKPKRGIKALIKDGFIKSDSPEDIAKFFLTNDKLDKAALGEYLGEGEPENIAIMHAFVDQMDFTKTRFVDALRRFLQSFRLPGEAQKIDRFMLKFAERYITGNPNAFANADTAYVLAYSVIMLNTDQHSTKMKGRRMTPEDFIKNNRGINDNADLPEEYLRGIFDEIAHNEIVLDTERERAANLGFAPQPAAGFTANLGQALATVGRDLQREAYVEASEQMANKTEQLFKSLLRAQRRTATRTPASTFITASSFKHVGPMFDVTWMPFLTALSGSVQETHNLETVKLCMEGQKLAIRVACLFDLENPRQAFVASLARFTNLYNLHEMKQKHVEALKTLLEVALTEANLLKEAWRDILTCISQLDRFQLIASGVEEGAVPDVLKSHIETRPASSSRRSLQVPRGRHKSQNANPLYQSDIAEESRSADMIRNVDRIFTNTANLTGDAIVYFVKALCQVSWQEIQSSGQSDSPRTYSLQKLVEISGYNMNRVRFEWTSIWQVLGEHFNQVGCHTNTNVVFFALNSLRQLSMKFMEIEELPGFKFQKDFLKPFEFIMSNSSVVTVKDMVLRCLIQMIQARGENIRSGWKAMFGVFTVAAKEPYEGIVNLAFENVAQIYNTRFGMVISQGSFADMIVCLTEFGKNMKFQKKALQAIETLKASVPKMLKTPECPLSTKSTAVKGGLQIPSSIKQPTRQTQEEQYWFPVLFAFHDVLMTGEDLEARSRALEYLFETLKRYGGDFPRDFWDMLWRQILYPIFMVLKSKSEMSKVMNHEDLSVWLSTTMIHALRHMINLFTHFFESLEYMLDRFLDLLALCICQENDTLARIGSNCLQQLILNNVNKFTPDHWHKIVSAFVDLFNRTEATALFSAATSSSFNALNGSNGLKALPRRGSVETQSVSELSLSQTPTEDASSTPSENPLGINGLAAQRSSSITQEEFERNHQDVSPGSTSQPPPQTPSAELEDYRPEANLQQAPVVVTAARRRFFNQIITKCVLQLLMIETVGELFSNDAVYNQIPSHELLRLMALLKKSYHFAKRFNGDRELRTRLFREGFMKQPPNLLKQESNSAAVYVSILFRMYHDTSSERIASRDETESALIPLCEDIISGYVALDEETQTRNIVTWRPVVESILDGYTTFPRDGFEKHCRAMAPLVVGLEGQEADREMRKAMQGFWARYVESKEGIARSDMPILTPTSPKGSVFGGRRGSRGR